MKWCRNPSNCSESPGYYESCFDRTSEHATRCTSDCTNVIQNTIDGEYCNTLSETLNITFDAPCPSSCSTIIKTQSSSCSASKDPATDTEYTCMGGLVQKTH